MKAKSSLFLILLLFSLNAIAQFNVSTGIDLLGNALNVGDVDPQWQIVNSPNLPGIDARVSPYYPGYWEVTPVAATNAGWLNFQGDLFGNAPGDYTFERPITIASGVSSFVCNFALTWDDDLISLEIVDPNQVATPITVVPTTSYHLSQNVNFPVANPMPGIWKIRAVVNFFDSVGAFLLSGTVDTTMGIDTVPPPCCTENRLLNPDFELGYHSTNGDGGTFIGCNSAFPNSYATNWCGIGGPQYFDTGMSQHFGITMWGIGSNFQAGEGLYQSATISKDSSLNICFRARFNDIVPTSPNDVMVRFEAYNTPPTSVFPSGTLIGEVSITNTNWDTYYLPNWAIPADFQYLVITAHNSSMIDDGQFASWVLIDDICMHVDTLLVGIEDPNLAASLSLYPNPASDRLLISTSEANGDLDLQIFDLMGRFYATQIIHTSAEIMELDIHALAPGHYGLRATAADGQIAWKRFVKQ